MSILRIKELLKTKGITGKELAERTGLSVIAMSNIVSGKSFPKPDLLIKIAEVLDLDVRDLFYPTKATSANEVEVFTKDQDGQFQPFGVLRIYPS